MAFIKEKDENIVQEVKGPPPPPEVKKSLPNEVVTPDPRLDPNNPTIDDRIQSSLYDPDVKVTELEKNLYLKAVGNDVPVTFDIEIPSVKMRCRLRTRNNAENDTIQQALFIDQDKNIIRDSISYVTRLHRYIAVMSVVSWSIGGGKTHTVETFKIEPEDDGSFDLNRSAENLRNAAGQLSMGMQGPAWSMVLKALRIFDSKMVIIARNISDPDFWEPAD